MQLTGASAPQIYYWIRKGLIIPLNPTPGSGNYHKFDISVLDTARQLVTSGRYHVGSIQLRNASKGLRCCCSSHKGAVISLDEYIKVHLGGYNASSQNKGRVQVRQERKDISDKGTGGETG